MTTVVQHCLGTSGRWGFHFVSIDRKSIVLVLYPCFYFVPFYSIFLPSDVLTHFNKDNKVEVKVGGGGPGGHGTTTASCLRSSPGWNRMLCHEDNWAAHGDTYTIGARHLADPHTSVLSSE